MNRVLGIVLVIFALGIAIVPHFTDCFSQGSVLKLANGNTQPMKCHWTAQAEIAVGVPLAGPSASCCPSAAAKACPRLFR